MAPRNVMLVLVLACALLAASVAAEARFKWNQTAQYVVEVSTTDWSNYDVDGGGCVTCPYTCVKRATGPTGTSLNLSNATLMASLPAIYSSTVSNGCCYASKTKATVMPDCNTEASPSTAEACGFLYGPTLKWRISEALTPPDKAVVRRPVLILLEAFCVVSSSLIVYLALLTTESDLIGVH